MPKKQGKDDAVSADALVAYQEKQKLLAAGMTEAADSAAGRALAILTSVAKAEEPQAATDLSPKLGLPKTTVHRLALLLEELGFLQREPGTKRFTVGPKLESLALDTLIHSAYRAERHAILQALVDEVGETCNITTLDRNEIVYIDRVESHWPLRTHFQPGSRVPIHCGASGKVFLSLMPARKRHRLLTVAPLKPFTDKTVVDLKEIERELKKIRSTQIGIDIEEFLPGLIGLAVPVFDQGKRMCATVSMHAPTARLTVDEVLARAPALKRAAHAVGKTFKG